MQLLKKEPSWKEPSWEAAYLARPPLDVWRDKYSPLLYMVNVEHGAARLGAALPARDREIAPSQLSVNSLNNLNYDVIGLYM